jgi:hypothetical protein
MIRDPRRRDIAGVVKSGIQLALFITGSLRQLIPALAAQPGQSRGRLDNNTSSQLIVRNGLSVACAPHTLILELLKGHRMRGAIPLKLVPGAA